MPLLFIFLLFCNTPCWHWWHSQVSWLFNYVSFSKSHFKLVVRSECQKQPKEPSSVEQFRARSRAVYQQELSENKFNLHLRVQKTSKQLTISVFVLRIFQPTCMFTYKEDSRRGITTVNYKEIQSRNEARIPQNTKGSTTCLHRLHQFGMTGERTEHLTMTATLSWNRRISVNVVQKQRSSV